MQGKALLLASLTILAALAGCVSTPDAVDPAGATGPLDALSEDIHSFGEFLALKVPAHDGVQIHVDVQLPNGSGPFPVLVQYTPYSNNIGIAGELWGLSGETGLDLQRNKLADFYVPKGYAVAIAHVRGSGQSGGCFVTGGPEEALDGYALVEGLANQSWSNGKVALMGTSYVGTTPISTAMLNPPHLTTIVPVAAVTEWYKYYFENGEPRFFGELPFGVVYTDQPLWMSLGFIPKPRNPTGNDASQAQCAAAQAENAYAQDDYNAYWMARNYLKDAPNATVPMLYAHGFLDENTPTSLVTEFFNAYGGPKKMWLQQHGHGVPARFESYHEEVHRWLDHWMLGRNTGALEAPDVIVQDNLGHYYALPEWPMRNATRLLFHFTAEGGLLKDAPADGRLSYTDEPRAMAELRELGIPAEGSFLRFETAPLEDHLQISGAPRVELVVASTMRDTQFAVLLYDVAPDGTQTFLTRGYLDARHRESLERAEDVTPGEEALYAWDLHPRDHHLSTGHRLALVLASTDKYVMPDAPGATNAVRVGPEGSRLILPVLDLEGLALADSAEALLPPRAP